jgi:hypothetical protein
MVYHTEYLMPTRSFERSAAQMQEICGFAAEYAVRKGRSSAAIGHDLLPISAAIEAHLLAARDGN